ncbi:MAG: hypothetical protein ACLUCI_03410 [Blautia hansenii]|jgi:hypothetical protein
MEIKRKINGTEVVITLTDKELNKAYHEQKDILDANEVRDVLQKLRLGEILDYCNFPYPSFHYLQDSKIKEAEAKIMEQEDLMLDIYDEFGDFMAENIGNYGTNMEDACEKILKQFGEAHPYFLKAYETIDVIAYKKYQQDWIKNHNFSNTFMSEIQQEYLEYKAEYYPHSVYTFQEYLDNYGFHGNCYASINEFRNIEYQDAVYMNSLLTEEEYSQYLMDVSEYMWHDIVSVNGKISAEKFPISGKMDDDCYQIDDFLEAVAKKYGADQSDIKTYMMKNLNFETKELLFGAEACGCYKNGKLQVLPSRNIKDEIQKVEKMMENLPNGFIRDADTVLVDILLKEADHTFSGFAQDIFNIWRKSSDKKSIEQLFYEFTDYEFPDYLKKCQTVMTAVNMADIVQTWLKEKGVEKQSNFSILIENLNAVLEFWNGKNRQTEKAEFFGQLMDTVESYLDIFGFTQEDIPSEDRTLAIEDGCDPEDMALIYGADYDYLSNAFAEFLKY